MWKITPVFAEWIASPGNVLFKESILGSSSVVLELGCGISGIVGLTLSPKIGLYVATDQDYVMKLLRQNIAENSHRSASTRAKHVKAAQSPRAPAATTPLRMAPLDWESHTVSPELLGLSSNDASSAGHSGIDALIACDCVYNDSLIEPLVLTCVESCQLRQGQPNRMPTICIMAQQLRSADVFQAWLNCFHSYFRVWRVPDSFLMESLKEGSGFTVHIGISRDQT